MIISLIKVSKFHANFVCACATNKSIKTELELKHIVMKMISRDEDEEDHDKLDENKMLPSFEVFVAYKQKSSKFLAEHNGILYTNF